jgi:hypothetical protein
LSTTGSNHSLSTTNCRPSFVLYKLATDFVFEKKKQVGSALGTRRAANGARTEDVKVSQKLHFNPGFLLTKKVKRNVSHTHTQSLSKLHLNPGFLFRHLLRCKD